MTAAFNLVMSVRLLGEIRLSEKQLARAETFHCTSSTILVREILTMESTSGSKRPELDCWRAGLQGQLPS